MLKKVDRSQIRDRSQAIIPSNMEQNSNTSEVKHPSGDGGLAGALAAALNKRKQKVSASGKLILSQDYVNNCLLIKSDDEAENDDW